MSEDIPCVRPQGHDGACRGSHFYGPPGFFKTGIGVCVRLDRVVAYQYYDCFDDDGLLEIYVLSKPDPFQITEVDKEGFTMFLQKLRAVEVGRGSVVLTSETKEELHHGQDLSERREPGTHDGQ